MLSIGVDFGGVLSATTTPPPGSEDAYLSIQPRDNAYSVIRGWRNDGHSVCMISKADGLEKQAKAMNWLNKYGFDELFGADKLLFCRDYSGKLALCREQGIEVMIDDTARQLELVAPVVPFLLLFGKTCAPSGMIAVADWRQTKQIVSKAAA